MVKGPNSWLAVYIDDILSPWKLESSSITTPRSFCSAFVCKVLLSNSIDSLEISLSIIEYCLLLSIIGITVLPLSRAYFHFSIIFIIAFCALWFWQNLVNSGKNLDWKKSFIYLKSILSYILDAWERKLTGWYISLLSSPSLLNIELTSDNLSWFGKKPFSWSIGNFRTYRDVKINRSFQYSYSIPLVKFPFLIHV